MGKKQTINSIREAWNEIAEEMNQRKKHSIEELLGIIVRQQELIMEAIILIGYRTELNFCGLF